MTAIVSAALGKAPLPTASVAPHTTGQFLLAPERNTAGTVPRHPSSEGGVPNGQVAASAAAANKLLNNGTAVSDAKNDKYAPVAGSLFERNTKAIVWGQQTRAIQGMLDFDYVCSRETPSVVASTYPFTGDHKQKFYFGQKEILVPAYQSLKKAFSSHPDATVMITFASLRSVYDTVMEALHFPQLKVIAIIAEGVPENQTRKIIRLAHEKGVTIIGPATVGGIKPGCFKIGNTGGMMDNILASKLYRPGRWVLPGPVCSNSTFTVLIDSVWPTSRVREG
jgi:ATP citrate (pro-S)-lyase